jgi:hemolysin III
MIVLFFWPIQILYHLLYENEDSHPILRRIDRSSMLLLVIAFFTPPLLRFVSTPINLILLIVLWILAITSVLLLLGLKNLSRKLAPVMGFLLGIIGIIALSMNFAKIPHIGQIHFLLGAIFLIFGGIVYAVKKPKLNPDIFGFHELYHLLTLVGTIFLHFLVINALIG